jgi:hypothetical protein
MIPGAFGSEITRIHHMDEVLKRHRHLLGLQVRNDKRARSSSAARLKRDRTPERCSRGLRRAPLPCAYAYRYRHRPDEEVFSYRRYVAAYPPGRGRASQAKLINCL